MRQARHLLVVQSSEASTTVDEFQRRSGADETDDVAQSHETRSVAVRHHVALILAKEVCGRHIGRCGARANNQQTDQDQHVPQRRPSGWTRVLIQGVRAQHHNTGPRLAASQRVSLCWLVRCTTSGQWSKVQVTNSGLGPCGKRQDGVDAGYRGSASVSPTGGRGNDEGTLGIEDKNY